MELRPCIDIHNGAVKQIVGSSLKDEHDSAIDNFVSSKNADYYANIYREQNLSGGHIIILNHRDSEYYEKSLEQARLALKAFPGGMMIGGGITDENAQDFIDMGASHVIVTSFVFKDGKIHYDRIKRLVDAVGKEHLVLDLSCRKKDDNYYIVTDRWQNFTDEIVSCELIDKLSEFCDEFLIHAVDVEGKRNGVEKELVSMLSKSDKCITYAGGVSKLEDIVLLNKLGLGKINLTVGSALSLFGGSLELSDIQRCVDELNSI